MTVSARRVNPWLALMVLCVANFLVLLDTTIVNTAAPSIMSTLDAGIDEFLWVLNGYLLTFAALLVNFGRLGDVLGPRLVFVAGLGLFTVASVLCGLSPTPEALIAARVAQGVGAAALVPQALVLISAVFPAERRGVAFGIFTAVAGIASVSGPVLGGFLITEAGWQSIFFLNVPVGLLGVALAYAFVPELRPARAPRFDLVGMLLATGGLLGIVYGLVEGERHHWGTIVGPVTIPMVFVAATALLVGFVWWERRLAKRAERGQAKLGQVERGGVEPIIPLRLFRNRDYSLATLITLIVSFSLYGLLLVFVIETQTLLGMSPLMSGVAALPWTIALSVLAPIAGRLADRTGGRILLVTGLALYALGVLGLAFIPTTSSTAATFVLPLIVVGVGMGMVIPPATTEAMRSIPPHWAGAASGVLNTARQIGAALGVAVIGAVLQNRLLASLRVEAAERAADLPAAAREPYLTGVDEAAESGLRLGSGQNGGVVPPEGLAPDVAARFAQLAQDAFDEAFLSATRPTMAVLTVVILAGCALAFGMSRRPAAPVAVPALEASLQDASTPGAGPPAPPPGRTLP